MGPNLFSNELLVENFMNIINGENSNVSTIFQKMWANHYTH